MGKKIAVLIGINYIGTPYRLYGCHNDVIKYKAVLIKNFGYKSEDIKMLIDLAGYEFPTKANIIKYMDWIYQQTRVLNLIEEIVFYYSGHGTNVRDLNGDELDRMDECIVPLDFDKSGFVTDDYIYENFLSRLKPVTKIICVFDSCNSASCTDLPYSFTCMNNKLVKQFYSKRPIIKSNPNIFVLSGCIDAKTSIDAAEQDGTPGGLLSIWLRLTLAKYNYKCSIENLIMEIKKGFGRNDQTPVLSVGSNSHLPSTLVFGNSKSIRSIKNNNNNIDNNIDNNLPKRSIKNNNINNNVDNKKKLKKHDKKKKDNITAFYKFDKKITKFFSNLFY